MRTAVRLFALAVALTPACRCEELPPGGGAGGTSGHPGTSAASASPADHAPPLGAGFRDDFDRAELGPDWFATEAGVYKIVDGALVVSGAYNHPLWLMRRIPRDAVIELDCWSGSDDGDLKVEAWGDGKSFSTDRVGAYTSTAYNFIFGGWHNQLSTLARMHEHGEDRQTRASPRVEKGRRYHWTITRRGGRIDWRVDGEPFLAFDDPVPLDGADHGFFAINDWEAELHFDNLVITPALPATR